MNILADVAQLIVILMLSSILGGLLVGVGIGYYIFENPISSAIRRVRGKRDLVLGLVFKRDSTVELRPLKRDGKLLMDEKQRCVWEIKRMNITRKLQDGTVVVEMGSDKPSLLVLGKSRIPLYILHEDSAVAASNPSIIVIDPDALASSRISARELHLIKNYAELLGMLRERQKLRDALFYFFLLLGAGIAIYMVVQAMR